MEHAPMDFSRFGTVVIEYYTKDVYGIPKRYVSDPTQAWHISRLTNTKTISLEHIQAFKQLAGIEFKHILPKTEIPI
jgi:hypothetical protein